MPKTLIGFGFSSFLWGGRQSGRRLLDQQNLRRRHFLEPVQSARKFWQFNRRFFLLRATAFGLRVGHMKSRSTFGCRFGSKHLKKLDLSVGASQSAKKMSPE